MYAGVIGSRMTGAGFGTAAPSALWKMMPLTPLLKKVGTAYKEKMRLCRRFLCGRVEAEPENSDRKEKCVSMISETSNNWYNMAWIPVWFPKKIRFTLPTGFWKFKETSPEEPESVPPADLGKPFLAGSPIMLSAKVLEHDSVVCRICLTPSSWAA